METVVFKFFSESVLEIDKSIILKNIWIDVPWLPHIASVEIWGYGLYNAYIETTLIVGLIENWNKSERHVAPFWNVQMVWKWWTISLAHVPASEICLYPFAFLNPSSNFKDVQFNSFVMLTKLTETGGMFILQTPICFSLKNNVIADRKVDFSLKKIFQCENLR